MSNLVVEINEAHHQEMRDHMTDTMTSPTTITLNDGNGVRWGTVGYTTEPATITTDDEFSRLMWGARPQVRQVLPQGTNLDEYLRYFTTSTAPAPEPEPTVESLTAELEAERTKHSEFLDAAYDTAMRYAEENDLCGVVEQCLTEIGIPIPDRSIDFDIKLRVRVDHVANSDTREVPSEASVKNMISYQESNLRAAIADHWLVKDVEFLDLDVSNVSRSTK